MNAKSILIPIAAFAVSVTGVSAFNSEVLERAGLTEEQKSAFEVARELREEGDKDAARDVLLEAGIDESVVERLRAAMHSWRHEHKDAIHEAVENNDYVAFKTAISDTPLGDIVTTKEDFELFVEAHNLREEGKFDEAKEIMEDLGFLGSFMKGPGHHRGHHHLGKAPFLDELTNEQKEALRAAHRANDKEAVKAILEEAGIERPNFGRHGHRFDAKGDN